MTTHYHWARNDSPTSWLHYCTCASMKASTLSSLPQERTGRLRPQPTAAPPHGRVCQGQHSRRLPSHSGMHAPRHLHSQRPKQFPRSPAPMFLVAECSHGIGGRSAALLADKQERQARAYQSSPKGADFRTPFSPRSSALVPSKWRVMSRLHRQYLVWKYRRMSRWQAAPPIASRIITSKAFGRSVDVVTMAG